MTMILIIHNHHECSDLIPHLAIKLLISDPIATWAIFTPPLSLSSSPLHCCDDRMVGGDLAHHPKTFFHQSQKLFVFFSGAAFLQQTFFIVINISFYNRLFFQIWTPGLWECYCRTAKPSCNISQLNKSHQCHQWLAIKIQIWFAISIYVWKLAHLILDWTFYQAIRYSTH